MSPASACLSSILSRAMTIVYVLLVSQALQSTSAKRREMTYQKLCKNSQIQVMSHRGVKIEPFERSRVELYLAKRIRPKHKNKLKLHFHFKTSSANGTLFYGVPEKSARQLVALTLKNGRPRYLVRCPTAYVDVPVRTRNNKPVNDNKWHSVRFDAKYAHEGVVVIDGLGVHKRYLFGCDEITSLVLGGHKVDSSNHVHHKELSAPNGHFQGCIRKVDMHHFLRVPPKYYAVSECD